MPQLTMGGVVLCDGEQLKALRAGLDGDGIDDFQFVIEKGHVRTSGRLVIEVGLMGIVALIDGQVV